MWLTSLFHKRPRLSRACRRRPPRARLLLEGLESRTLLSGSAIANVNTDTEDVFHNETTLAVNPTNPLNLIGSANDYQFSYNAAGHLERTSRPLAHVSFDGGQTWTEYPVPFSQSATFDGDPAVALDAGGTAYLTAITTSGPAQVPGTGGDLVVTHSTDGGKTWSSPVLLADGTGTAAGPGTFNDKDYIAAWGHGNAIVTWSQIHDGKSGLSNNLSSPIMASVTHDGGNTWTDPVAISGSLPMEHGAVPVVAADGSIYVAFYDYGPGTGNVIAVPVVRGHYEVVKVDPATGQPLGAPVEVSQVFAGPQDYPINLNTNGTLQDSEFRVLWYGNITADPTNARHLAVVWSDMRNSTPLTSSDPYQVKTNSDIIISQSFDGGATWSAPTAIKEANDQFMPWAAYDATGHLHIGYYDRSYDPANHQYGYTLASEKTPGSLKFTLQQLTTALSDPTQGNAFFTVTVNSNFPSATTFIGDYSAIAVSPTGVDALWTDMRLPSKFPGFPGSSKDAFFADPPARRSITPAPAFAAGMTSQTPGPGINAVFLSQTLLGSPPWNPFLGFPTGNGNGSYRYLDKPGTAAQAADWGGAVAHALAQGVADDGGLDMLAQVFGVSQGDDTTWPVA
jgi:hypothetical protein